MSNEGMPEPQPTLQAPEMTVPAKEAEHVAPTAAPTETGEKRPAPTDAPQDDDYESKRRKRLELNRKAAQESRKRKKARIEELQRSVVYLTRDNARLREQNEQLRQALAAEGGGDAARFPEYNWMLKMALGEGLQNLKNTLSKQGALPAGQAQPGQPPVPGAGDAQAQGVGQQALLNPADTTANLALLANQVGQQPNLSGLVQFLSGNRNALLAAQGLQGQQQSPPQQQPHQQPPQQHMAYQPANPTQGVPEGAVPGAGGPVAPAGAAPNAPTPGLAPAPPQFDVQLQAQRAQWQQQGEPGHQPVAEAV